METTLRWYVVHTQARGEGLAMHNLARQGFTAFLPQYKKRRRHARRTDWVSAPLFPRYLFVAIDVARARWRAVSSTIGVTHLICQGDRPVAVPDDIVEDIMARMDTDSLVPVDEPSPFQKGDVVKVTGGSFADQVGLFECTCDEERITLLLDLLGRQVAIKLPRETVVAYP